MGTKNLFHAITLENIRHAISTDKNQNNLDLGVIEMNLVKVNFNSEMAGAKMKISQQNYQNIVSNSN